MQPACGQSIIDTGYRSLNPAELSVLRAQYEREGDMVGVQTKFNYAWVRLAPAAPPPPSAIN